MDQSIRFVTTADGVKLAYAASGDGPPLLKTANWLNHLEFDWKSPAWQHGLARCRLTIACIATISAAPAFRPA